MRQEDEKIWKLKSGMKSNSLYACCLALTLMMSSCLGTSDFQLDPNQKLIEIDVFEKDVDIPAPYQWVDCRPTQNYLDGHIPGAISIWRDEMADDQSMILPREDIEQILSEKGVREDAILILYDDHGSCEAARFWWVMDYYGFDQSHILNGGFGAWKSSGYPVVGGAQTHPMTQFKFTKQEYHDRSADMDYILSKMGQNGIKIIDARTEEEYDGSITKNGAHHGGSIPGSIHIDFMEAVSTDPADDKRILPLDQLVSLYEQKGIYPQDTIITFCHSGARSAHTTFILTQLLGYDQVRNYDGSWIEWSRTFQ